MDKSNVFTKNENDAVCHLCNEQHTELAQEGIKYFGLDKTNPLCRLMFKNLLYYSLKDRVVRGMVEKSYSSPNLIERLRIMCYTDRERKDLLLSVVHLICPEDLDDLFRSEVQKYGITIFEEKTEYTIGNARSFDHIRKWLKEVKVTV